jgi:hypothetical protein
MGRGDHLEQLPHLRVRRKPGGGGADVGPGARIGMALEHLGTLRQPHGRQEGALGERAVHDRSALLERSAQSLEIDMAGEVAVARALEHVREAVGADRLQRVAGARADMAIVDDQGRAAHRGEPGADACAIGVAGR